MFVGGMTKKVDQVLPDSTNPNLTHKVKRNVPYFNRTSSARTAMDKTNKNEKDKLFCMRIKLDIKGDEKAFFPIELADEELPFVPGEGLMTVDHNLLKSAKDAAAKQVVEETIGKYRVMWFFVVERGNYKTRSGMAQYTGISSSPGAGGPMDKDAFTPDEFGSGKKRKQSQG